MLWDYILEVLGKYLWIKAFHFNVFYTIVSRKISGGIACGWQCVGLWERHVTTKLLCWTSLLTLLSHAVSRFSCYCSIHLSFFSLYIFFSVFTFAIYALGTLYNKPNLSLEDLDFIKIFSASLNSFKRTDLCFILG